MQKVPSCTKTRDVELKRVTLQRKQSDHPGKVNWWPIRPRTQWQEQSRQRDRSREPRCRKALPTNRHIAWRSGNSCRKENPGRQDHGKTQWVQLRERVLITLESWDDSHMVRARRLWSIRNIQQKSVYRIQQKTAPQGGFHGRPQRSRDRIQRRGDARVHETNREIALRGWPPRSSSSREEEGDGTQEVLPRTTTTLVVLKASGITPWQSQTPEREKGSDGRPRCCKVPRPNSESTYRETTTTQWCRRCQTRSPRVRRCKLPQSGAKRAERRDSSAFDDPEQTTSGDAPSTRAARGGGDM